MLPNSAMRGVCNILCKFDNVLSLQKKLRIKKLRLVYIYASFFGSVEDSDFLNYSVIKKHHKNWFSLQLSLRWVLSPWKVKNKAFKIVSR